MEVNKELNIHLTTVTLLKTILILVGVVMIYNLSHLILVLLIAVVIAASIEPATKWFVHHKVARLPAVLLIYVAAFILFAGVMAFFLPPFFGDLSGLVSSLPKPIQSFNIFGYSASDISALAHSFGDNSGVSLQKVVTNLSAGDGAAHLFASILTIFGGVFNFIILIVISFYLAVQERGVENFLRVITPYDYEPYVLDVWGRTEHMIGRWFQGQLLLGLIIGPLVYIGLTILGVKYALLCAILAMMFEIIPFLGPILSAVPGVLLGFTVSLTLGLEVIALYLIIQQIESNVIYPLVAKKVIGIPPLVVIIAILAGGELAGFFGIVLAVPIAVLLMELLADFEKHKQTQAPTAE